MVKSSRVFGESKLFNDVVECLESLRDMNTIVKTIFYMSSRGRSTSLHAPFQFPSGLVARSTGERPLGPSSRWTL